MSVKITTNQNTVTVADADKSITIINNREPNRIDIVQPESDVIYVAALGPQGPQGPAGTGGGGSSDLTALNNFSASILTFTGSIQTQVNNLTAATSSYVLASVTSSMLQPYLLTSTTASMLQPYVLTSATSSMIVSGALTASYYIETDPIFVAKSASLATTGSNIFYGNQTVNGDLTVTGSITALQYIISSSIIHITESNFSGSHIFGNSLDDTHQFTGSVLITGSVNLVGNQIITGSLLVTQSHISTVDYIDYRVLTAAQHPTHAEGRIHWLDDTKTLQIDTDVNNFSIEVGHQNVVRARNTTGFDLAAGKVVYINGESGNRPTITTASWDGDPTSASTLGFVVQLIGNNQTGYVVTNGMLRGINTNAFAPGTQLYLSSSGDYTSTIPTSPKHEVRLGKTITQATDGVIYVDIMNGYELGELHDVLFNNSTNGDLVVKSGSLWINSKQLTGSYGLTGSLTVTSLTSSLFGTASWAHSSSQALTASYINSLYTSNFTASFGSSTTWTINHNLNTRYVIVQTFDSNHNQILPQEITLTNTNTATATFSAAESGYAVITVGGALLNSITPGGSSGQVQYNNGGALGGSSNFTFDGTYTELYGATGYKALSTLTSDYYTTTELLNNRLLSTAYVTDFAGNEKFAGDMLVGTVSATSYDLVYLDTTDSWLAMDQTDSAKATRMLGIYDGTNVFIEGYVVVGENGVASNVPLIAGTLTPGAPVYIKESATSAPFLDTTVPTSGVVRILGHLVRNEGSGYWFMKFRPDHTWVKI